MADTVPMLVSVKLGLRNLRRNRWRSALTVAAVTAAVAPMIWLLALYEGALDEMVRGSTTIETGQVQLHTAAYIANPRVYETFHGTTELWRAVASVDGVGAVSPRVRAIGLIGNERRSRVARIVGVDPEAEAAATPIRQAVVAGRWLAPAPTPDDLGREVVLGTGLAHELRVEPGDELVIFLEAADGSLGNDRLEVVGLVRTANTRVDRTTAYLHMADAQFLAALEGEYHELMIRAEDIRSARRLAAAVASTVGGVAGERAAASTPGETLVARPWQEITPGIHEMIVLFRGSYWVTYLLIYLVAANGIVNTARMSALERRREFGVMLAIGMRPGGVSRTILAETAALGLAGAIVGGTLGLLVTWYHARVGLDLGAFTAQGSFSFMGVAFSERIHFTVTPLNVVKPIVVMLGIAVLGGLWPAITAARIDPAPTLGGRS